MTPEEIVSEIQRKNRSILHARQDYENLTSIEVLELMNAAGMQAFRFGGEVAMSVVKGTLLVKQIRCSGNG